MSLSNNTKTVFLDPTVQNSSRTEFRLPDGPHLGNIRIADLGVYDTNVTTKTGLYYPSINGCITAAKRIALYSMGVKIDEIQELNAFAAIRHLRTTNRGSEDINRFELLNGMGLSINTSFVDAAGDLQTGGDSWTLASEFKDYRQSTTANTATGLVGNTRHHNQFQVGIGQDKTSGMVLLKNYLRFLQSTDILDLPDLTLVIDWNLNADDYYQDLNTVQIVPSLVPIRPTLILEKALGLPPRPTTVTIPFMSTIVDSFTVAAATAGVTKAETFRSGAFRNRFVKDLTFFNKVTDDAGWLRAKERSPAMVGEKLQLVVNGSKYLPDQGIDQPAQKFRYFNDTHGSLNLPLAAGLEGLFDSSGNVLAINDGGSNVAYSSVQLATNFSVTAVKINDIIERLDVEYQRTGAGVGDQVRTFKLLCFGTCANVLELKNGQIRLSY